MQSLNEPVDGTHSATAFRAVWLIGNGTMKGLETRVQSLQRVTM